jgi:ergothioneine biosynthesis protein EgtB
MTGADLPRGTALAARYVDVRRQSEALAAPLSSEDAVIQSMPDASPAKWHLAHTTWFFETFVLAAHAPGYVAAHPEYRDLFNSYYNAVGEPFPRAQRGLVSRPDLAAVRRYRRDVDTALCAWLGAGTERSAAALALVELGLHHEQQHQELLLTDLKHLLSCNPLLPAYRSDLNRFDGAAVALRWIAHPGGLIEVGHADDGFGFDNEGPAHRAFVAPFELAHRPASNADYLAFVEAGGYAQPQWWMADGWAWRVAGGIEQPLYWRRSAGGDRRGGWTTFTLGGERKLAPDEPVCHLSWYEADAFARWCGARLPTEVEWEHAARRAAVAPRGSTVNDLAGDALQPMPARAPASAALVQLFGDVWEWTGSAFLPYPGFQAMPGAVGEYNGKFMCNQFVLRGGSCVTPAGHVRASYRNFFPPEKRWQFTGVRLAR